MLQGTNILVQLFILDKIVNTFSILTELAFPFFLKAILLFAVVACTITLNSTNFAPAGTIALKSKSCQFPSDVKLFLSQSIAAGSPLSTKLPYPY